jgi:hypothetical protein
MGLLSHCGQLLEVSITAAPSPRRDNGGELVRHDRRMRRDLAMAAIAAGRLGIGVIAAVRPELAARSWVDRTSADGPAARVFARALGGRDIALAAGALVAFRAHDQAELRRWAGMGAIADAVDAIATVACWSALPKTNRLLVLAAAAAAIAAAATASRMASGPIPTPTLELGLG